MLRHTKVVAEFTIVFAAFCAPVEAQFNTPTINGTPNNPAGEYGSTNLGENMASTSTGQTWYVTWDDVNFYVGITNAALWEAAIIYFDINPIIPVNGGTNADGSLTGQVYDNGSFAPLPFRADFVVYFKSGYNEYRLANGSNGWTNPTQNTLQYAENNAQGHREVAIPWNSITDGKGRPASFNWFGYLTSEFGDIYGSVPSPRFNFWQGTGARDPWYLTVESTEDGSSTFPFAQTSFTFPGTGSDFFQVPTLDYGSFSDLTLNRANVFLERDPNILVQTVRNLVVAAGDFRLGTAGTQLEVTRDVWITGGQLTLGTNFGGDLRVRGDIRLLPGGSLVGNNRQLEMMGTQDGVIGGDFTGSNSIQFLSIDRAGSSVEMDGDVEVSARLWTRSGILETNGNTLTVQFSGPDTANNGVRRDANDTGYVRGKLHRVIGTSGGKRQFPVGTNPAAPLTIDFDTPGPTASATIAVSTSEGIVGPFDADNMIARAWQVDVLGSLGSYNASMEFRYNAGDVQGSITEANLRTAKQFSPTSFYPHASTWLTGNGVETNGYPVSGARDDVSLQGLWILSTAPDPILRVDLVSFSATATGIGTPVVIEWETAAEYMNAGFNLYRMIDASTQRRINAFPIPALGSETIGAAYSFTDPEPMKPGEVRSYVLEDIEFTGVRTLHGPATVGPLEESMSSIDDWMLFGN